MDESGPGTHPAILPGPEASIEDHLLAQTALERGLITPDQLRECYRRVGAGRSPSLAEAMVSGGFVAPAQLAAIRSGAAPTPRPAPPERTPPTGRRPPEATPATGGRSPRPPASTPLKSTPAGRPTGRISLPASRTHSVAESTGDQIPPEVEERMSQPDFCFDKFVLVEELGRGGMGTVWKAWQRDLKRWVAIKFLSSSDEEELQRFCREAQTAARLSHPNICSIFDLGEVTGRHYIVMEFVDGPTVHELGRLQPPRAAEIVRDAARALAYAHGEGVIHRDMKPHNIMVTRKGRVYVMDFGLAKAVRAESGMTVPGMILGTPSYMPPEQAEGRTDRIDRRSDVYSLGATLYTALAGKPPFVGRAPMDIMYKVVHQPPPPLRAARPEIPADLEMIALRALEKDPARRYPTAKAMADDLDKVLRGEPIGGTAPAGTAHRSPALWIAAVAGGLLVLAGAVAVVSKIRGQGPSAAPAASPSPSASPDAAAERAAKKTRARGDLEQAARALETAAAVPQQAAGTWEELLEACTAAERAADRALSILPDHEQALLIRGRARALREDFDGALADFEAATRADPQLGPAHRDGALACIARSERLYPESWVATRTRREQSPEIKAALERAQAGLRRYLELGAEPDEARYARALMALASGELAEAEIALKDLTVAHPKPEYLLALARIRRSRLDLAGSMETLRELVKRQPNHYAALRLLALNESACRTYRDAIATLDRMHRFRKSDPWPLSFRGTQWGRLAEFEQARRDVEAALALNPRLAESWLDKGLVLQQERRFEEAAVAATEALKIDPRHAKALEDRGVALFNLNRHEEALRDLEEALKLDPRSSNAMAGKAASLSKLGRNDEAIAVLRSALEMDPLCSLALRNLSSILHNTGRDKEAVAELKKVADQPVSFDPSWASIIEVLYEFAQDELVVQVCTRFQEAKIRVRNLHYHRGRSLLHLKRYAEALVEYEEHFKEGTPTAASWNERGAVLCGLKRWEEALRDFREAVKLAPGNGTHHRNCGTALLQLKRYQEAAAAFRKAIEVEPKLGPEIQKDLDAALKAMGN